jgi:hypothetical protein
MDERGEQHAEDLHTRLREVIEHVDALRREAADLEAELRNHLHTLTVQRAALRRLDHDDPIRRPRAA